MVNICRILPDYLLYEVPIKMKKQCNNVKRKANLPDTYSLYF